MFASRYLLPACMLLGAASAIPAAAPAPTRVVARDDSSLDPWVTVNESGQPKTVTPVLTTISGTPTVISAAPYELTGTVFTQTNNGDVRTTTGSAPLPTATNAVGAGVFEECTNLDGDLKPFCMPSADAVLYPGSIYYVTWDPTFFNGTNTTVQVVGFAHNTTTNIPTLDQAFSSAYIAAGWGFYQWPLETKVLGDRGVNELNVTIRIAALAPTLKWYDGPRILVTYTPVYHQPAATVPSGAALYIGLPTIAGFIILVVAITFIWNRKHRQIGLGNIMSRARHGYGMGKNRTQRMLGKGRRNKEQGIRLMEREFASLPEEEIYRDVPVPKKQDTARRVDPLDPMGVGIARRDSDALGSLAGTPTEDRHMDFGRANRGNAFRDELDRQHKEKY